MRCRYRRLNRIRPVCVGSDRRFRVSEPLGNLRSIPARAILFLEQYDLAPLVDSRIAPRVMQQHHREQTARLRLRWHQRDEYPRQPNRLGADRSQQSFARLAA